MIAESALTKDGVREFPSPRSRRSWRRIPRNTREGVLQVLSTKTSRLPYHELHANPSSDSTSHGITASNSFHSNPTLVRRQTKPSLHSVNSLHTDSTADDRKYPSSIANANTSSPSLHVPARSRMDQLRTARTHCGVVSHVWTGKSRYAPKQWKCL